MLAILQRRASLFMAVALFLAGIAGVGAYYWLEQVEAGLRDEIHGTSRIESVVVANEDIPAGTAISSESVRLVSLPIEAVPEGWFGEMDRVSGRISIAPFRRNEPVLETKLAPVDVTRGGIAMLTGQDKRAIAVLVDEIVAVAGFIQQGDRVDVLATLHTDEDKSRPMTKIILENVPVLAIGEHTKDGAKIAPEGVAEGPHVMTLEVSPREAEKLTLAASEGRIHLVLRHPLNGKKVDTEGATVDGLLGFYRGQSVSVQAPFVVRKDWHEGHEGVSPITIQEPAVVSRSQHPVRSSLLSVELIQGLQRSEVKFAPPSQSESSDEQAR
jgi:pilus assembly protein CpaB